MKRNSQGKTLDRHEKNDHTATMADDTSKQWIRALLLILFSWLIAGTFLYETVALLFPERNAALSFIIIQLPSIALLLGILLALRFVLLIPLRTFILSDRRIRIKRDIRISLLFLLLLFAGTLAEGMVYPGSITRSHDLSSWISFLPIVLIITPLQTAGEELFFRTFLGRWAAKVPVPKVLIILLSGLIFLSVHLLNPEIGSYGSSLWIYLYYALFGALMMWIAIEDDSFELPICLHMVNNLFSLLFVSYDSAVLESRALFYQQVLHPAVSVLVISVGGSLLLLHLRTTGRVH